MTHSKKTKTQPNSSGGNLMAIITMFFLFAMIAFVTNLAAPLGTVWASKYNWAGMMGNMMNFLAYLFMGIPAGRMIQNIGYKKTALVAMATGFTGLLVQYLSSFIGTDTGLFVVGGETVMLNFLLYLVGAFICGFCVCMLNTVVNPLLNTLGGGGKKGNQLLQAGGALNSLSATLTPLFVGVLIGQITANTSMTDVVPLLFIAMGVFALSFLVIRFVRIPDPALGENKSHGRKEKYSAWSFRHTVLGVIGIFFYVGIEVGIPGTMIFYISDAGSAGAGVLSDGVAIAGALAATYWLLMLVGRVLGSAISGKVSPKAQLIFVTSVAISLIVAAILIPKTVTFEVPEIIYSGSEGTLAHVPLSALLLILCGLCTSVMWGGIFNLAVAGLGKYTAQASGIFMMMVVGGGVMPLIQDFIAKSAGYMASYWLVVAMLIYLLFYGISGSRNVNTDIPVELENEKELGLNQ